MGRGGYAFLALLLLLLQAAADPIYEISSHNSRRRPSTSTSNSVFSLLELKRTSKLWSNRILRTSFEDLERTESRDFSKEAVKNYTESGNLARYLNFTEIDAIYLPVPLNLVFVGFDGHGNHDVNLGEDEIERWFTTIDNVIEHTRIPQLGEALTPFYRLGADGEQRHHLPLVSYTHYNYSVHAFEMPSEVAEVFEFGIKVLSRRDDSTDQRNDSEVQWQVDLDGMSYLYEGLAHYLHLDDNYTIFIVNPKPDAARANYGYRRGLSRSELKYLKGVPGLTTVKSGSHRHPLDIEKFKKPLLRRMPRLKFSWTSSKEMDMSRWTETYMESLRSIERALQTKTHEEIVSLKAREILGGKNSDLAALLRRELKETKDPETEECLVDAWVGQGRWAFLDLTAGPFSWGPTVGGENVRTAESFPSVKKHFGSLAVSGEVEGSEGDFDELQASINDRFSALDGDEGAVEVLLAEVDVYEMFAERHCRGRKIKIAFCQELQERMDDIQRELDKFRGEKQDEALQKAAVKALESMEKWNIFGDIHEHVQNFSVARDSFLAHVGSTIASAMKHVVTPSTAEGAFHFHDKVTIQLYIITQEKSKHVSLVPVDVAVIKEAMSTLALPLQTFHYNVHRLALSEDPALAMAFSVARRAAVLPVLLMNGTYQLSKRDYLDSIILQQQLKQLNAKEQTPPPLYGRSTLEVPVFWFINSGVPVLIDKHYQAKALPDMVIVSQSASRAWESHLQCNGRSISWDLSSPVKAAVAAVAEHLAGLMPTHLTYSHAHDNADEDWSWSVGSHPFSSTSAGYMLSGFYADGIARSYIVTALDESIQRVNSVAELLSRQTTHEASFRTFKSTEHALISEYNNVVGMWKRIAGLVQGGRFGEAVRLGSSLNNAAERLVQRAKETASTLHPVHCTEQRKWVISGDVLGGFFVIVVLLGIIVRLRRRNIKPKIN